MLRTIAELGIGTCPEDQPCAVRDSVIAPHVHVCVTGNGCVLLDLRRDKYLGLGRRETEVLAATISEWPQPTWDHVGDSMGVDSTQAEADELCRGLVADGILVPARDDRVGPANRPLPKMQRDWISIGDELEVPGRIHPRDVATFMAAFVWARGSLSLRPFWMTVESVRASKSRGRGAVVVGDILDLAARVDVFRRLRPFLFAAEDRCLLHALTLLRFLRRYGFYPEWVIGVATQPWGAHSWVQWGDFLLDSNPEKVCRYTPIMMV
jgi:hypothetical protein